MCTSKFMALGLAAVGAIALSGSVASAGSQVLGGWTASWNDTPASDFSVSFEVIPGGTGADRVVVTKTATFGPQRVDAATGGILPIDVVFQQTSYDAQPLIIIQSESVTNNTGKDWKSFRMDIVDGTTSVMANQANFDASSSFNGAPFSTFALSSDGTTAHFTDGMVANGATWTPGGAQDQLVINAMPVKAGGFKVFVLEEQPSAGSMPIPLPAAAWSGLSGLLGMGLFGAMRKLRA